MGPAFFIRGSGGAFMENIDLYAEPVCGEFLFCRTNPQKIQFLSCPHRLLR